MLCVQDGLRYVLAFPFRAKPWNTGHQHLRIRMQRMVVDLLRRAHLYDTSSVEDHRFLAYVVAQREVVCYEEDGQTTGFELCQQVENTHSCGCIEHADDLVCHENLNVKQQSTRDEKALQLSTAQLVGKLVHDLVGVETNRPQRTVDLPVPFAVVDLRERTLL